MEALKEHGGWRHSRSMEALKEYAGVITAAVTVFAALGALGLWAINVQVTPEFNRLEGRIEQLDGKLDANLKVINDRFNLVDERFERVDDRFDLVDERFERIDDRFDLVDERFNRLENDMNNRFDRVESEITTIRNDIKTILLRLPPPAESG